MIPQPAFLPIRSSARQPAIPAFAHRLCPPVRPSLILLPLLVALFSGGRAPAASAAVTGVTNLAALPRWEMPTSPPPTDWLIDPKPFKAGVYQGHSSNELVLANGLVARTFRLSPNLATVGLDNLATGEAILRGVKPEATVELDGHPYDVGGLKGQPNYAFLRPEWIEGLRADPAAFRFVGFETGVPQERFSWKRVRHHAPDAQWPPPGASVRFDFAWPENVFPESPPSSVGRALIWEDKFQTLDPVWKISASGASERVSFQNEGKPGEIYAPAGNHCFAERSLPPNVGLIEVVIHPGTDQDTSWGPGVALLFPRRIVEVNLRPGDRGVHGQFELRDNGRESLATIKSFTAQDGGLDVARAYRLRARLEQGQVIWDVADAAEPTPRFHALFKLPHEGEPITSMRIGKTDRLGGARNEPGSVQEWYRSRLQKVRVFGPFDAVAAQAATGWRAKDIRVSVHYELYDGLPCYSKWLTIYNGESQPVRLNRFSSDWLAAVERVAEVDELSAGLQAPNLHIETDMAFGGMMAAGANRHSYRWVPDPEFHTQVNYQKLTPCLLQVGPDLGPDQIIAPGTQFASFRAWVMPFDSFDRERSGLAMRRLYRAVAPWSTENPLMMHVRSADGPTVTNAINQCAEVGFEMVILSFGSGFNLEDERPAVLARARDFAAHAHSKGIEIGSYSLLASRSVGGGHDVVMPEGQKPAFGHSPCLVSQWGTNYFRRLYAFHRDSGFSLLEHDGSYPGDVCVGEVHPGHRGLADSRWNQWREISRFYQWCRERGLFLNVPDHYFMSGSSKTGMGYREVNWSLPREQQVIHTRQNIFDGTWQKTPSMGWMFVPLTEYQGGGAAATIEPLDEHLDHYERMLYCNLALGVQACYRGPRLYDTDRTKAMLSMWVAWYKKHRDILESDLIHGRRADARDLDWMLHVNPHLSEKGMLVVFNPLTEPVQRTLRVNLYYTGLQNTARLSERHGLVSEVTLRRDFTADIPVQVPAQGMNWFVIR